MSSKHLSPEMPGSFPIALAALGYAGRLHAGQRRQADGAPFILHPLEVAGLLYHAGARDHVIAAGFLHDAVEKTDADAEDLKARFGSSIAEIVVAVSEQQRIIDYAERKQALYEQVARAGPDALSVFAADKISKIRELRLGTAGTDPQLALGPRSRSQRLAHYRHCLRLLEELMTGCALVAELRKELEEPPNAALPAATAQRLSRAV